ncbi:hypothetical protein CTAYLR_002032 [Chrysophaeum taylorii]|uniref:A-kinase anchor protein 7-like phosphoesterase domain-containing protein n=1 Tax=Chrysophaeum taylorii TaxID=2483200 RepID=A0AAD7XTW7_9STRA|nr:hypothetical protein CTAYLR_002032 [Chrysophaeum taylorii]
MTKRKSRRSFTHFYALRIACPSVLAQVRRVHELLISNEPALESCLVAPTKLHVTMGLLAIDDAQVDEARAVAIEVAARAPATIRADLPGLDAFGTNVLFARVQDDKDDDPGPLARISADLENALRDRGLCESDEPPTSWKPHATICKLSKWRTSSKCRRRPKKIEPAHFEALRTTPLGPVVFTELLLLEMAGASDGFYPVVAAIPLGPQALDMASSTKTRK